MSLSDRLKNKGVKDQQPRRGPLWKGPVEDGITFSMLSRFLCCRERFRVQVIEGLRPTRGFNHRIEYGQMWHVCEEALADGGLDWERQLKAYCTGLAKTYPLESEQIDKWYNVCKVQFPVYVDYWSRNPDVINRTPLMQEQVFNVPYKLPSGVVVRLRGKFDSVDLIDCTDPNWRGVSRSMGVYLQENKTKGDVNPLLLQRQLTFDLQTMMYLTALHEQPSCDLPRLGHYRHSNGKEYPIRGVRYNVIRRPLSGGKGSIVQKKGSKNVPAETKEEYYDRLQQYIVEEPHEYFMRWKVDVTLDEVNTFRRKCLDPLLSQVCQWYSAMTTTKNGDPWATDDGVPWVDGIHWQHPFGVFNVLDEGGATDLDEYLTTGSRVGLEEVDRLFTELEPE